MGDKQPQNLDSIGEWKVKTTLNGGTALFKEDGEGDMIKQIAEVNVSYWNAYEVTVKIHDVVGETDKTVKIPWGTNHFYYPRKSEFGKFNAMESTCFCRPEDVKEVVRQYVKSHVEKMEFAINRETKKKRLLEKAYEDFLAGE